MDQENINNLEPNRYYLELGSIPESMSFLDIWQTVTSKKIMILALTAIFVILFGFLSLIVPTNYKAEAIIAEANPVVSTSTSGTSGATVEIGVEVLTNEALAMMTSRVFLSAFIKDNSLMPILFENRWHADEERWIEDQEGKYPTLWDGYDKFADDVVDVSTSAETNLTTVAITWTDPELASLWANKLVEGINTVIREKAIDEASRTIDYLTQELQQTTAVELQQSLYELMKAQKAKIVAANVYSEYAFKIIDPAVVPEEPAIPYITLVLVIVGLIIGLFFSVTLVLLINLVGASNRS